LSDLTSAVVQAFAVDGILASSSAYFQPREGQTQMALAIAEVVEQGGELVVEAGTGVGKTYAYLVPVLLSGQRALVSTATKALQDQLYSRDIPKLIQTLGLPVKVALLKGRGSYLCLHRLEQSRQGYEASDRAYAHALAKIETWSHATFTGDLSELSGLDDRSPVIPLVTSTRENCLGSQCPKFRACHVNLARKEALAADVVVINHHLFFADLTVRESGMAELLPTVRVTVFDEAHQLNEIGVNFLGHNVTTGQLIDLARDVLGAGLQLARGLVDWSAVSGVLEKSARDLRLTASEFRAGARLRWTEVEPSGLNLAAWQQGLSEVQAACKHNMDALETVAELAPDFVRLYERFAALLQTLHRFETPCAQESVRWLEIGMQLRLVESPLDIADAVQAQMLGMKPASSEDQDLEKVFEDAPAEPLPYRKAFIFTSATLGDDAQMRWFTEPCGLMQARLLQVSSPFNYADQAGVYVPRHMPRPNEAHHSRLVAELVGPAALTLGGRTLVLTTTLAAMRSIGQALSEDVTLSGSVEVLVQGQGPKRRLMERFRQGAQDGQLGCILVASASFWEGFDVPGQALQLVVIDKLPFPPPNDPLVEARSARFEREGRSAFAAYSLPEAAVALKQGAGRLIRSETDHGILVVCDPRLTSMGYGKRLLASLPAMRVLQNPAEFEDALARLTRISTRP
jgi:ATP-dependent DNA helicase DinG